MREFDDDKNLEELIKISLDRVKILMETNTVVGEVLHINEYTSVIPISKATVGFVVGGGEYADKSNRRVSNHFPMAGGSGCGMSVSPVGFIVIINESVKFVDVENKSLYQTLLNMVNAIVNKASNNGSKNDDEQD